MDFFLPLPLFHLLNLVNAIFCLFASLRLYLSYRKTGNDNIKYFLGIFFSLTVAFSLASLPGIFVNDPVWVQVIYIFLYLPLFYTGVSFLRLAYGLLKFKIALYGIYMAYFGMAILSVLTAILFFPASRADVGSAFFYWREGTPAWLQSANVIFIGLWALGCSFMFFWEGWKIENKKLRYRSFLIGLGMFMVIMSGFINYIVAVIFGTAEAKFASTVAGGFLSFLASAILLYGIYYKLDELEPG